MHPDIRKRFVTMNCWVSINSTVAISATLSRRKLERSWGCVGVGVGVEKSIGNVRDTCINTHAQHYKRKNSFEALEWL